MEPWKPADRQAILKANPRATAADLDEYERLLSKRYAKDPSAKKVLAAAPDPDEVRLQELIKKIFGQP
jgi:hypothetical protein